MSVKRVLIIRFSSLGDIILLTSLFRETHHRFADASIDFLTTNTFSSLCQNNPHLDTIITFDKKKERSELFRISKLITDNDYDLVLDAHYSLRSRLVLSLAYGFAYSSKKIIHSIDKRSWKRNLLLLTKVNLLRGAVSQREAYCQLLGKASENQTFDLSTELFPAENDYKRVNDILHQFGGEGKKLVAIGPGASFQGKCWPKENYLELSDRLQQDGYLVVLLGGTSDMEPQWISSNSHLPVLNVSGKLSFLETAAMLQKCVLSISNDSAIVHFSEAVSTPSVSIFGPTVKEFGYGPYLSNSALVDISLPCRPCSRNGKGKCRNSIKRQCLIDISVDKVLGTAKEILSQITQ